MRVLFVIAAIKHQNLNINLQLNLNKAKKVVFILVYGQDDIEINFIDLGSLQFVIIRFCRYGNVLGY